MKKNFTFKTVRGAAIKFAVEINHSTTEVIDADGDKIEVVANKWSYSIENLTINGNRYNGEFTIGKDAICTGYQGNKPMLILLSDEILSEIFGEERNFKEAKAAAELAEEMEYQANYNRVKHTMCEE